MSLAFKGQYCLKQNNIDLQLTEKERKKERKKGNNIYQIWQRLKAPGIQNFQKEVSQGDIEKKLNILEF